MNYLILHDHSNGIYELQLNRPEKHNAFNASMIRDMRVILTDLALDPYCELLLITAKGQDFSAGADLEWMQASIHYTLSENLADARSLADLLHQLKSLPVPTIALVQGKTFGGGIGLLACCDIVIAEYRASFCFSEVKIGLIPAVISPFIINAMGHRQTQRLCLTAASFSASQALAYGLVSELIDTDKESLMTRGLKLAEQLRLNSPEALKQTKALFSKLAATTDEHTILDLSCQAIANARVSPEGQEGVRAFLEKRPPNWQKTLNPKDIR